MLAYVLDGNEAARLNNTLVRQENWCSANASYSGVVERSGAFY